MEAVQKRLNEGRVGARTPRHDRAGADHRPAQDDVEALKKAKQDLENKPSDPKPSDADRASSRTRS